MASVPGGNPRKRTLRTLREAFPIPVDMPTLQRTVQTGRQHLKAALEELDSLGLAERAGRVAGIPLWSAVEPGTGVVREDWLRCRDFRGSVTDMPPEELRLTGAEFRKKYGIAQEPGRD